MNAITPDEFRARQSAFAQGLEVSGLDGAVVFSRGGGTLDRYGDVLYLANFYQTYGYLPETPGLFSGRAHTALVIGADGRSILCLSVDEYDDSAVVADDVRCSLEFAGTVAGAVRDLGVAKGRVGLVGADVLPVLQDRLIRGRLPDLGWVECDEILHAIRRIKCPAEQRLIREAARIHAKALENIASVLAPGLSEADTLAPFIEEVTRAGAGVYFASMSSGPKIAHWCSQSIPGFSTRTLEEGDMLRFDTGIVRDGYLSDFGHTLVCGSPSDEQTRLIQTVQTAVDSTIAAIAPGRTVRDVVADGERALKKLGVSETDKGPGTIHSSFPVHWGHGLGMGWERPMMTENDDTEIRPGMYLAIERTLTMTGTGTAAAEQTLLVTETGAEVISEGPNGRWRTIG